MEKKYTKGKWLFKKQKHSNGIEHNCIAGTIESQHGLGFEVAAIWDDVEEDEAIANAHLIAAAPELLEALGAFVNAGAGPNEAMQKAKRAIAKALGNGIL